jgi:pimeloyl-ACP methyl ester carboxylesterase
MTEPTTPQTFVLVHGAWHGGWCWRRVANLLQHDGHTVYTPTLTGLADRSHLMSRMITLDTHIADIVNLFRWEELDNVVLCAHSYAGWVVAGALETIHDQVKAIVLLDAHFPRTGERGVDASNNRERILRAEKRCESSTKPPTAAYFQVNKRDRAWVNRMLTPQPIGVSFQPLHLTGARERITTKVYIRATGFTSKPFNKACRRAKQAGFRVHRLDCGHDVMIDAPEQLAQLLRSIAAT